MNSLHFKNWPLPSQIDNDILMDDDFDPVQCAKNAPTVFKAIPKVIKRKGRPKTEKCLKPSVEIGSTRSIRIVNSNILNFFIEREKGKRFVREKKTKG